MVSYFNSGNCGSIMSVRMRQETGIGIQNSGYRERNRDC